jgi:hypothetical protein
MLSKDEEIWLEMLEHTLDVSMRRGLTKKQQRWLVVKVKLLNKELKELKEGSE